MTTKLTGEQLTEKFFIGVMGWEFRTNPQKPENTAWKLPNNTYEISLPPLHTSLDLQEKWLWPELMKKDFMNVEFLNGESFNIKSSNGEFMNCGMRHISGAGHVYTKAPTKALAQLEAGLKALGVNDE
jgi:hypothetical protein